MMHVSLQAQFNAPVSNLFAAFYKPELLVQWFAPGDLMVAQVMADFREGGKLRLVIQDGSGAQHVLMAQYREISENQRLVFDWQWQGEQDASTVTLNFSGDDSSSSLDLLHEGFKDQQECEEHQHLWMACLEKLSVITL